MLSGALAKHRIQDLSLIEQERQKRKEGSGKIVQKYGEITVEQGRKDIEANDEDELRVVNIRNQRLAKPWKAKYKKVMEELTLDGWDAYCLKPI
jgi:adenylate kinase